MMPISPSELVRLVGCRIAGSVPWYTAVASQKAGVYVVSLHGDPDRSDGLADPPISRAFVAAWLKRVPDLTLDKTRPKTMALVKRLTRYWLPDEPIVYIGKANSLRTRISAYYKTDLGDKSPHHGGHWIKTLSICRSLTVHYSEVPKGRNPEHVETQMLFLFGRKVSRQTRAQHPEPELVIPFANLEIRGRRDHGIRKPAVR